MKADSGESFKICERGSMSMAKEPKRSFFDVEHETAVPQNSTVQQTRARAHKREKNRNRPCVVDSAEGDEMGLLQIWQMTTPEQPTAAEGEREREERDVDLHECLERCDFSTERNGRRGTKLEKAVYPAGRAAYREKEGGA